MGDKYWRLNPPLTKEISLDKADEDSQLLMRQTTEEYLRSDEAKCEIQKVVNDLVQPEDYEAKALKYLLKAANLIEYTNTVLQRK